MVPLSKLSGSLFVVFEGVDGAGKTTLIGKLREFFDQDQEIKQYFKKIIYTREPGSPSVDQCQTIRNIVLNEDYKLNNKTKALLFFANRSEHIEKLIDPAIKEGGVLIICDRFYFSTLAYQGADDKESIEWIKYTQNFITKTTPDITFFLSISTSEYINRYNNRKEAGENNTLDHYLFNNFGTVHERYMNTLKENKRELGDVVILEEVNNIGLDMLNKIKEKIISRIH